jgi:hypothetical protein
MTDAHAKHLNVNQDADETKAEQEIQTAIDAARIAPVDQQISGLGPSPAALYLQIRPDKGATPGGTFGWPSQYSVDLRPGEKPLLFIYFVIKGLGESIRLLLAESGLPYDHIAVTGGEDQSVALEWRSRSPNGLLPMISGLGIPRSAPVSQSGTIMRYLAKRLGMNGMTQTEEVMADVLFETSKDIDRQMEMLCAAAGDNQENKDMAAKGPFALAVRVEKMLSSMSDPRDHTAVLNYGQIELLNLLLYCEMLRVGIVRDVLGSTLDGFRVAMMARPGIASYLAYPGCFPTTKVGLRTDGGYIYGWLQFGNTSGRKNAFR